jgi:hypothetical protein
LTKETIMATSPTKAPAPPPLRYVLPTELKGVEYARTDYRITPDKPIAMEDLVKPRCWAHVASKLRTGDVVEVVSQDMSWFVRLLVRHIEGPEVFVGVISESRFESLPVKEAAA